ncbi:MAG TPA: hypothetical protein VK900_05495 [Anaerolineales bacterium]|nr:hypothetical protein [Anaerolineales bacterium]
MKLHPVLVLLITSFVAYGLLIPWLGFYWDDLPMSWIRYELGPEAMTRYFSTNRPVWGLLYQITTRLLPQVPAYWQMFALLWRWLGAVVVWAIVCELWKDKPVFALGIALLFLLYPGFNQQWGSYLYSHFFIVLFFFLLSIFLMLRRRTIPALIFSALNLWMMEYFFPLEFARVGFIWTALRDEYPNPRDRIGPALKQWTSYLVVFALAVFSRLFIFNNQVYEIGLASEAASATGGPLFSLIQNLFTSLWTVTIAAWGQVFTAMDLSMYGLRTVAVYTVIALIVFGLAMYSLSREGAMAASRKDMWYAIGLGFFLLPFAGAPFWLTGLSISLAHPASRFTLPFMLGLSLIVGGLLALIPSTRLRALILAVLVGLAAGRQFLWSTDYLRDWQAQKDLFWQMSWRAPGLQPGTLVLMNEELSFYADNSLSAPLNWIYAPDQNADRIDYVLFYPTNRLSSSLPALQPDLPIQYDYIAGQFNGNTSQAVVFYYDPPACLRLLEPEIDAGNRFLLAESFMREASALSNRDMILPQAIVQLPSIYGPEPEHSWCYYFQKADLARQQKDWRQVVTLGDTAFELDDHPNNPVERFVFIEGFAHTGDWDRALQLSRDSYRVSREYVGPLLCRLWERIALETPDGSEKTAALAEVRNLLACTS